MREKDLACLHDKLDGDVSLTDHSVPTMLASPFKSPALKRLSSNYSAMMPRFLSAMASQPLAITWSVASDTRAKTVLGSSCPMPMPVTLSSGYFSWATRRVGWGLETPCDWKWATLSIVTT